MSGEGSPIRLVLDTSAVLAYAAGSFDLGETMTEVIDEGARFAVPALCLAEAARQVDDDQAPTLALLATHTAAVVVPLAAEDWQPVGAAATLLGSTDRAVALLSALRVDGYVATTEPQRYDPDGSGDLPLIEI